MTLRVQLQHVTFLAQQLEALSTEIADRLANSDDALTRLQTIPGSSVAPPKSLSPKSAPTGSAFLRPATWSLLLGGLKPGPRPAWRERPADADPQGEQGAPLGVDAKGHAAGKIRTYLGAVYHRLAGRRGKKRAAVAVGRHILIAAYAILKAPGTVYADLSANDFDERDPEAVVRR